MLSVTLLFVLVLLLFSVLFSIMITQLGEEGATPYARSFRRRFFAYHHAVNHPHKILSYHDLAFL